MILATPHITIFESVSQLSPQQPNHEFGIALLIFVVFVAICALRPYNIEKSDDIADKLLSDYKKNKLTN